MAKIECEIEEIEIENDHEIDVPGVRATCGECGHETESYGTGDASRKRCLVLLREECPEDGKNFYVEVGE